jgi:NAD-dependent deacetylase
MTSSVKDVVQWLHATWDGRGSMLVLTGAGVSAESGVPTFRGEEGYWRIDSRNYYPEELATREAFARMPDQIWGWYLYRRSVCRAAQPNAAHIALARLEQTLRARGDAERLLLVTQNVDGLHLRAGSSLERTYQIHGNIDYMRAWHDRDARIFPVPPALGESWERGRAISSKERALLVSPHDQTPARPHVLWFDESYDEERFRFESTLAAVKRAALVIVVGTSGATNLPTMVAQSAYRRGVPLLVINRDPSPFSELALRSESGHFHDGLAGEVLPALVDALLEARARA